MRSWETGHTGCGPNQRRRGNGESRRALPRGETQHQVRALAPHMIYILTLLVFVTEYLRPTSYVPALEVTRMNSLIPLMAFGGALVTSAANTTRRVLADANTRVIGMILLLVWISVLTSDVQEFAWNSFTKLAGYATIYWSIASQLTSIERIKGVFRTLVGVHIGVAILNPLLFTDPSVRHYISSGNFLGDGNDFALSIDIILPFCLLLLQVSRRMQWLWTACLVVLVAGIVATQSRGGTVGLVCMSAYYWTKSRRKMQTAAVAIAVVVLIFALAPGAYFERMNMIGDMSEGSASARIMAWTVALQMAADNPLLGVGAGHFVIKFGNEYRPADAVGSGMNAHSVYFSALGELGLPGLFSLLAFFWFNFSENRRLYREIESRHTPTMDIDLHLLASVNASLIAFAAAGAFLSAFYYPHLYVLGGILVATRSVLSERSSQATTSVAIAPPKRPMELHRALQPRRPTKVRERLPVRT